MGKIVDSIVRTDVPLIEETMRHPLFPLYGQHPGELRTTRMMIEAFKPRRVLEIGIALGCATLGMLDFDSSITDYDGVDVHTTDFMRDYNHPFAKFYDCALEGFLSTHYDGSKFDLIHIDADHYDAEFINLYLTSLPHVGNPGALVIIHDMNYRRLHDTPHDRNNTESKLVVSYSHLFSDTLWTQTITREQTGGEKRFNLLTERGAQFHGAEPAQFIGILK